MSIARCDLCGQCLDCVSDSPFGYGKMSYVHPKPCIPKWGRKTLARKIAALIETKDCIVCKRAFRPAQPQSKMCSPFCVNERKNRSAREKRAA